MQDDRRIFEKICIEGFDSVLSYVRLPKKSENFRRTFDNSDFVKTAKYDNINLESLMNDKGLIRNERKLKSAINITKCMSVMKEEFGSLDSFV